MMVMLQQLQTKLDAHFTSLAQARRETGHRVFALEHGLSTDEIDELGAALNRYLSQSWLDSKFWLLWVVYAAEQGYNYDGREYWQSFEARTDAWAGNQDRDQIRTWFRKFATRFFGVEPSGTFASYRTIICWPVSHAILPKDLQVQLAHAIYNARYELRESRVNGASEIGRLISDNSWYPTSRYWDFLTQQELVGQIVIALLEQGNNPDAALHPSAQVRLSHDLGQACNAKEWLDDARQEFSRPDFKIKQRQITRSTGEELIDESQTESLDNDVNKRPVLRPMITASRLADATWRMHIRFPTFQPLAKLSPDYATYFYRERMTIPHSKLGKRPAEWLLVGGHYTELTEWPGDDECLLQFDTPPPFQTIINAECCLPKGPVWPFKVGVTGEARLILGGGLQPGGHYVLLSRTPISVPGVSKECTVHCKGLSAVSVDLPPQISPELQAHLKKLGLQATQSIRVEPVAFAPRSWDAHDGGEWTTQEEPCFQVSCDSVVDRLEARLNDEPWIQLNIGADVPTLVCTGRLPPGRHVLALRTVSFTGVANKGSVQTSIPLVIREPRAGMLGAKPAGLMVDLSPLEPSIDDLLTKQLEIAIDGETSRTVRCSVVLLNPGGEVLFDKEISKRRLPISRGKWMEDLGAMLQGRDDLPFLQAASGHILIDGEDLGELRISLQRHYGPMRWSFKASDLSVSLVNDGDDDHLQLWHFSFANPITPISIPLKEASSGFEVKAPGGLFVATSGLFTHAIVVAKNGKSHKLAALKVMVDADAFKALPDLATMRSYQANWGRASITGFLSQTWRNQISQEILRQIVAAVFGPDWARAEAKVLANPGDENAWDRIERSVLGHNALINYAVALSRTRRTDPPESSAELCARFEKRTKDHTVWNNTLQVRAAWRIASDLGDLSDPLEEQVAALLNSPEKFRNILRGARLLWLCSQIRAASVS